MLATIPLVLAITMLGMWMLGINLHKISLGALIIALGLLVDDAIIAVEMMVRKLEEGPRAVAVTAMYETTAMPMLTGTLITAVGFLPIALAKSVGRRVHVVDLPGHCAGARDFLVRRGAVRSAAGRLAAEGEAEGRRATATTNCSTRRFIAAFARLVDWCVEWRKTVIAITIAALALGIGGFRFIRAAVLPGLEPARSCVVNLWLPEGSTPAATERKREHSNAGSAASRKLDCMSSYVGTGAPRFYLPLDQQFPQHQPGRDRHHAEGPRRATRCARR